MRVKTSSSRVTLKDVAEAAGVSACTASRAINGTMLNKISEDTRLRVLEIAASMGYKPNIMARGLAKKRTNLLGVLLPDLRMSFMPETLEGIWHEAEKAGMGVMLYVTDWDSKKEAESLKQLLQWRVDGIIWAPVSHDNSQLFAELNRSLPLVQLLFVVDGVNSSKIVLDDEKGGYLATKYLIDKGHTRIAHCFANKDFDLMGKKRLNGYLRALKEANIPIDNDLIIESSYSVRSGIKAFSQVMNHKPTAVFCCCDTNAWGLLQAANLAGVKVPDKLAIVGFDNLDICEYTLPSLTTIAQPQKAFGEIAVQQLINALENKPQETVVLEPVLVERGSS